jgi:spore coat protein A, manganese oxidase
MNFSITRLALGALVLVSATHAATADVVDVIASKDNTLYAVATPDDALSNGAGQYFFTGRTDQGNPAIDRRRGVLAFDLSVIPPGSSINSVTLTMRVSRVANNTNRATSLHRLLTDWGEGSSIAPGQEGAGAPAQPGDATWFHTFFPDQFWSTPGGDFTGTVSATTNVGGTGFYTWSTLQMAADVQMWLDNSGSNFGWLVMGVESIVETAKRFDSRNNSIASRRPRLTIDFTPPAVSGACCLPGGVCEILAPTICAAQGGVYQGDGTSCTPNPCTDPIGACCFADGDCQVLTSDDCATQGGAYQGDESTCSPNPCPQPLGACCLSGVACIEATEDDCIAQDGTFQGAFTSCDPNPCPVNLEKFVDALPIPGVLQPVSGQPGGAATYELAITEFQQQLHRDLPPTTVWGYGGSFPGPTFETTVGEPITITFISDLRDELGNLRTEHYLPVDTCMDGPDVHGAAPRTVPHLHGGHVPMEFDGYPEWTILPGGSLVYEYPNAQLPATIWYHDHALGITRLNVYMGLAGFYIIRDDYENYLGLPAGENEIALAIQDRMFHNDGSLKYPHPWQDHFHGDVILVNGKAWPYLNVKQGKYRFRTLNGSNSRTYTLSLSNGATFHQIGTDGGLLSAPVPLSEVTITPGERADLVIDFASYAPGTEIILTNSAPIMFPGEPGDGVIPEVMKFILQDQPGHTAALPATLREVVPIDESEAVEHRDFILRIHPEDCAGSMWKINNLAWHDITEFVQLDTVEVWSFINRSAVTHPMHMHLVMFQILDRQYFEVIGGEIVPIGDPMPPAPNEAGWKDTVRVDPDEIVRVIARFETYTGNFAYHCHILEHEDHEMMRQFQVVPACALGDLNCDGVVDVLDLLIMLDNWGECEDCMPGACPADLNGDCAVDVLDLLILLDNWG